MGLGRSTEVPAPLLSRSARSSDLRDLRNQSVVRANHWVFNTGLLFLLAPSVIVWASFCPWPLLTVPMALLAGFIALRSWAGSSVPSLGEIALVVLPGMVVALLLGVVPPFSQNSDWIKHYALFNTLVQHDWPIRVQIPEGAGYLRYSLGYYVIPALCAKILGGLGLPYIILFWTGLGLGLVFALLVIGEHLSRKEALAAIACFTAFSGADAVGTLITGYTRGPPLHIEWWAGFGELSSSVTNLIWAPQHALSGWLGSLIVYRYPRRAVENAGLILAAVVLWSPFSAIGLLPLLAWALVSSGPRSAVSPSNVLLAPVLLASAAVYLSGGSGEIPFGLTLSHPLFTWGRWSLFCSLEIILIAAALLIAAKESRCWVIVAASFLLLLTLINFGNNNDLLMRGSIPALAIFAAVSAKLVVRREVSFRRRAPLILLLLIGIVTPGGELVRGLTTPRISPTDKISIQDVVAKNKVAIPQYLNMDPED